MLQGYLPDRLLDRWRWRQGAPDSNKELDFDYLLRGRRYLRCHHGHRLLIQAQLGRQ